MYEWWQIKVIMNLINFLVETFYAIIIACPLPTSNEKLNPSKVLFLIQNNLSICQPKSLLCSK